MLVLAQLFNALAARSESVSALRGLGQNLWLWGAIALSALLQVAVVHVPVLQRAFGTAPLDAAAVGGVPGAGEPGAGRDRGAQGLPADTAPGERTPRQTARGGA